MEKTCPADFAHPTLVESAYIFVRRVADHSVGTGDLMVRARSPPGSWWAVDSGWGWPGGAAVLRRTSALHPA